MSDESNKPIGQPLTEVESEPHQLNSTADGTSQAGNGQGPSVTSSTEQGATEWRPSDQEQTAGRVESYQANLIPESMAGAGLEPSGIPTEEQNAPAQRITDSATSRSEKADKAQQQLVVGNLDSHTGEANELAELDIRPSKVEALIDATALDLHDKILGQGDDRFHRKDDLVPEGATFTPSPMLDLIREGSGARQICVSLVEWYQSKPKLSYGSSLQHLGQYHFVPQLPMALHESLLLPTGLSDYRTTRELFESIHELLQHLGLSERQTALLTYWCMASWFSDVLDFIPRLTVTGPKFAADLLLRLLRSACRRPVLLVGMNSAALRIIPVNKLMPTLLIRETSLSKHTAELLEASDQKDYFIACGKELQQWYCARCIYLGEDHNQQALVPHGIHVHVAGVASSSHSRIFSNQDIQALQNKLFRYRAYNRDLVRVSRFRPNGLLPELCAVGQQLGAVIVDDPDLQRRIIKLLQGANEQARVDRSGGIEGIVLRAVLFHCHQEERQQVFAREIAATVHQIYNEEGETLKVSSETVGHVLKGMGLYSRRLGNAGRGLVLDKSTQSRAHRLGQAYEVLPTEPACGYCHQLQVAQSKEVV